MHLKIDNRRLTQIDPDDRLVKLAEAAKICACDVSTIKKAIEGRELKVVRLTDTEKWSIYRVWLSELHRRVDTKTIKVALYR
jgi:hypothetical protein